jgi:hypothetical protein
MAKQKYMTLDESMTKATGMNKEERKAYVAKTNTLLDEYKTATPFRKAQIDKELRKLNTKGGR